jgi:hypothetical protein
MQLHWKRNQLTQAAAEQQMRWHPAAVGKDLDKKRSQAY